MPLYKTLFNKFKPTSKTFRLCSFTTRSTSFPMACGLNVTISADFSRYMAWSRQWYLPSQKRDAIGSVDYEVSAGSCDLIWICCAILWCTKTSVILTSKALKPSRPSKKWRPTISITPWMQRWFPPYVHPMSMWLLNRRIGLEAAKTITRQALVDKQAVGDRKAGVIWHTQRFGQVAVYGVLHR